MQGELTSSILLELVAICSTSCSFGIIYAIPFPKPGSASQEEANMFFSLKLPSTASQKRLRYLIIINIYSSKVPRSAHCWSDERFSQPSCKVCLCGHVGHWSARSPGNVEFIPFSMCPRPPRFISFKWRYWCSMRISCL